MGVTNQGLISIFGDYAIWFVDVNSEPIALSLQLSSMAFAAATGWRIVSNTYPVQPAISLIDSNLAIMMPPYEKPETVAPADLKLEVQLLVETFPTSPKPCCDANNQLKTAGTTCRAAASFCQKDAVCDGALGECPANPNLPNNSKCPLFPASYGPGSTLKALLTTKEEAAKLMAETATRRHKHDWHAEPCDGRCTDGVCALRADSPRCCTIPIDAEKYAEANSPTAGSSSAIPDADYSPDRDFYCWK